MIRPLILIILHINFSVQFKLTWHSIEHCKQPDLPLENPRIVNLHIELYKSNNRYLARGNFTVKEDSTYLWRLKGVVERSGDNKTVDKIADMKGRTCRDILPKVILSFGKVNLNTKTCMFKKGVYSYSKFDLSLADLKIGSPIRVMGMNIWYLSLYNSKRTGECIEMRVHLSHDNEEWNRKKQKKYHYLN